MNPPARTWTALAAALLLACGGAGSEAPALPLPASDEHGRGLERLEAGDAEAAIPLLEAALGRDPARDDVRADLALALLAAGHPERTLTAVGPLLARRPPDVRARVLEVEALLALGRVHEAWRRGEDLANDAPRDADAWYTWGRASLSAGRHEDARRAFEKALDLSPGDPDALHGLLALAARDPAEEPYPTLEAELIPRLGDDAAFLHNRGAAAEGLGRFEEAEALYRKALERDPDSAWSWYNLARVIERTAGVAGAADAYRRFLDLAPRDARRQESEVRELLRKNGL